MNRIVFATHNQHKVSEIQSLCHEGLNVVPLSALNFQEEIPETQATIEGNAVQKAEYIFNKLNLPCFAEDTGLEVAALNGAPGVKTARYAGEQATAADNIEKLLAALSRETNRNARFKTIIAFIDEHGKQHLFEGICEGEILEAQSGGSGFGYDPVFKPSGSTKAFAEMSLEEKNFFSHRAKAFAKFVHHLNTNY